MYDKNYINIIFNLSKVNFVLNILKVVVSFKGDF